jgi:hypothetical protein
MRLELVIVWSPGLLFEEVTFFFSQTVQTLVLRRCVFIGVLFVVWKMVTDDVGVAQCLGLFSLSFDWQYIGSALV